MARHQRDPHKERFWRRLLQLFQRSGLSVRAFCAQQQISEPSFYSWRRLLQERDANAQGRAAQAPAAETPLFVPVTLAPPAPPLEILLPTGLVVRVPPGFDPVCLQQLLNSLR